MNLYPKLDPETASYLPFPSIEEKPLSQLVVSTPSTESTNNTSLINSSTVYDNTHMSQRSGMDYMYSTVPGTMQTNEWIVGGEELMDICESNSFENIPHAN